MSLASILLLIFAILGFFIIGVLSVDVDDATGQIIAIVFLCSLLLMAGFINMIKQENYKKGQVDALSGSDIKYELKVQPDSTRVWVKKNE